MGAKGIRTNPPKVSPSHSGQARASARKKANKAQKGVVPIEVRQQNQAEVDAIKAKVPDALAQFASRHDYRPPYSRW